MASYRVRWANIKDKKAIYKILIDSFFPDVPLFAACNVNEPLSIDEWPGLQELDNGLSVVALNYKDEIVGVAVNIAPSENTTEIANQPIKKFIAAVDRASDGLVTRLENTTMELCMIAVAKAYRGKGISKKLIQETENVAKCSDRTSVYAIATGAFIAAAFSSQNWEPVFTYVYKDHLKVDPSFRLPPRPHDALIIFEKHL